MKQIALKTAVATAVFGLWSLDFSPEAPYRLTLGGEAHAVVGAPWTPVSAAGVARRTTRRAVYATSAFQPQQA